MKTTGLFLIAATTTATMMARGDFQHPTPGIAPGMNTRYATDAYPGFDADETVLSPERKEPRWFSFITGPDRDNAKEQYEYCQELVKAEDYSKAAKQLDALVRGWPVAPEAPLAQQQLAEILGTKLEDYEESFREYRYLLDFYSLQCDYDKMAAQLYRTAQLMEEHGKEIMFVRFANTVDSRKAYEACVLRAPGARWVPKAMLTIARLREDEQKDSDAIKVYENLRNLYPDSAEAKEAIVKEARVRMGLQNEHEYNRARCQDTIDFMRVALKNCNREDANEINGYIEQLKSAMEEEIYLAAKFYDSPTRTKRSAIDAYEDYLNKFPNGKHSDSVRARLEALKGDKQ